MSEEITFNQFCDNAGIGPKMRALFWGHIGFPILQEGGVLGDFRRSEGWFGEQMDDFIDLLDGYAVSVAVKP